MTLEPRERNLVQTAIRGNLGVQRVAQELRNQWPEEDLKRRDQGARQQGLCQNEVEYENDEEDGEKAWHYDLVNEAMTSEGLALMGDAEVEAEQALTLIAQGKQTTLSEGVAPILQDQELQEQVLGKRWQRKIGWQRSKLFPVWTSTPNINMPGSPSTDWHNTTCQPSR